MAEYRYRSPEYRSPEYRSPRYSSDTWSGSPIDIYGDTSSYDIYPTDVHDLNYEANIRISGSCEAVSTINIVLFIVFFFLLVILLSVIFYKMNIYRQDQISERDQDKNKN